MRRLIQDAKLKGLPGGEAHRVDNYITMIGVGFERLCAIKEYRTPRAVRAPLATLSSNRASKRRGRRW